MAMTSRNKRGGKYVAFTAYIKKVPSMNKPLTLPPPILPLETRKSLLSIPMSETDFVTMSSAFDEYGQLCYAQARADLLAELVPVAWRISYNKQTAYAGHNAVGDYRQFDLDALSVPLAIIPKA